MRCCLELLIGVLGVGERAGQGSKPGSLFRIERGLLESAWTLAAGLGFRVQGLGFQGLIHHLTTGDRRQPP